MTIELTFEHCYLHQAARVTEILKSLLATKKIYIKWL